MNPSLMHPEWVAGRRLWIDPVMQDLITRIKHGDPTKGWEGDERLDVFGTPTDHGIVWEILRLEDDGEYRSVARSKPGVIFDERVIEGLVAHDIRRKPKGWSLHEEVIAANEAVDAAREKDRQDWVENEIGPRLRWGMQRDGDL